MAPQKTATATLTRQPTVVAANNNNNNSNSSNNVSLVAGAKQQSQQIQQQQQVKPRKRKTRQQQLSSLKQQAPADNSNQTNQPNSAPLPSQTKTAAAAPADGTIGATAAPAIKQDSAEAAAALATLRALGGREENGSLQRPANTPSCGVLSQQAANEPRGSCSTIKNKPQQVPNSDSVKQQPPQKASSGCAGGANAKSTTTTTTSAAAAAAAAATAAASPAIAPALARQQQQQQQVDNSKKPTAAAAAASLVVAGKQLSQEEADDGIELDGSSNSGSSVKDTAEDIQQLKSASVSPVLASASAAATAQATSPVQSARDNQINERARQEGNSVIATVAKQPLAEPGSAGQLASTLCSDMEPVVKSVTVTATALAAQVTSSPDGAVASPRTGLSSKQQELATRQAIVEADECQLQEKLANKQRKAAALSKNANGCSFEDAKSDSAAGTAPTTPTAGAAAAAAKGWRRSSSQSIQDGASDAAANNLCKVCNQHVYQMERLLAEKSVYHKRCFRCQQCKIQLRVDNYSSHEGQAYCKAHHRQLFQPQVKLDDEDDVDIVAKSSSQPVDDYLVHRGRLSERSFSFLQQVSTETRQRQMIICENEPAPLPEDVVRSDTKMDDGIDRLNLNLNSILRKFEQGGNNAADDDDGAKKQPSSAGIVIEKPSFDLKKTLLAFESGKTVNADDDCDEGANANGAGGDAKKPIVVRKLTNLNNEFLKKQDETVGSSRENGPQRDFAVNKPVAVRRSESLMQRLKKYESHIAGEPVEDDGASDEGNGSGDEASAARQPSPAKFASVSLSALKSQWESGDIRNRRDDDDDDEATSNDEINNNNSNNKPKSIGKVNIKALSSIEGNSAANSSPLNEKNEELLHIKRELARRKAGGEAGSIRNIYENAIKEAKQNSNNMKRDSSDLSALNGFSTSSIQQQLLQRQNSLSNSNNGSTTITAANGQQTPDTSAPSTPNNKDHFQLNLSNRATKLKARFEMGLINNSSRDDSASDADNDDDDGPPPLTKLEQIRQEKLEDLSVFTDGEIKAREARSMFQQIDKQLSSQQQANGGSGAIQKRPSIGSSRSLTSVGASMRAKLINQMNSNGTNNQSTPTSATARISPQQFDSQPSTTATSTATPTTTIAGVEPNDMTPQPIRLTNNVRT